MLMRESPATSQSLVLCAALYHVYVSKQMMAWCSEMASSTNLFSSRKNQSCKLLS